MLYLYLKLNQQRNFYVSVSKKQQEGRFLSFFEKNEKFCK